MWTMEKMLAPGVIAEETNQPHLGQKTKLWWDFIQLTHYVTPLLHCEIGIGNDIFQLWDIINEYIEDYPPGEESIQLLIPNLKQIIADTVKERDEFSQWIHLENTQAHSCHM